MNWIKQNTINLNNTNSSLEDIYWMEFVTRLSDLWENGIIKINRKLRKCKYE